MLRTPWRLPLLAHFQCLTSCETLKTLVWSSITNSIQPQTAVPVAESPTRKIAIPRQAMKPITAEEELDLKCCYYAIANDPKAVKSQLAREYGANYPRLIRTYAKEVQKINEAREAACQAQSQAYMSYRNPAAHQSTPNGQQYQVTSSLQHSTQNLARSVIPNSSPHGYVSLAAAYRPQYSAGPPSAQAIEAEKRKRAYLEDCDVRLRATHAMPKTAAGPIAARPVSQAEVVPLTPPGRANHVIATQPTQHDVIPFKLPPPNKHILDAHIAFIAGPEGVRFGFRGGCPDLPGECACAKRLEEEKARETKEKAEKAMKEVKAKEVEKVKEVEAKENDELPDEEFGDLFADVGEEDELADEEFGDLFVE